MLMRDGYGYYHEVPDQLHEAQEYGSYGEPDYGWYGEPAYDLGEPEYGWYGAPDDGYGMGYSGFGDPVGLPFLAPLLGPAISALAPMASGLIGKLLPGGGGGAPASAACPPCPACPACPMCAAPLSPPPVAAPPMMMRRRRRY